jgi:hypothetical protein
METDIFNTTNTFSVKQIVLSEMGWKVQEIGDIVNRKILSIVVTDPFEIKLKTWCG